MRAYITNSFPETLLPMGLTPALGSILSALICITVFIVMKKKNNLIYKKRHPSDDVLLKLN